MAPLTQLRYEPKLSWETFGWCSPPTPQPSRASRFCLVHSLTQFSQLLVPLICSVGSDTCSVCCGEMSLQTSGRRARTWRARSGGLVSTVSRVYPVSQLLDHNLWLINRESFWIKRSVSCRSRCRLIRLNLFLELQLQQRPFIIRVPGVTAGNHVSFHRTSLRRCWK